jgi:periplasmic mercuric ion binding protein
LKNGALRGRFKGLMKTTLLNLVVAAGLTGVAFADASITLNGVHNCCGGCEKGITKAIQSVEGATAVVDGESVTITAKNTPTAKKALESLMAAGYAGTGEGVEVPATAASTKKLSGKTTVTGAHLCCGKCVKAVQGALKEVKGITSSTVESKAKEFTVEGEFSEGELIAALNKAGFHGTVK